MTTSRPLSADARVRAVEKCLAVFKKECYKLAAIIGDGFLVYASTTACSSWHAASSHTPPAGANSAVVSTASGDGPALVGMAEALEG